jgi:hypothetical protein
MMVPSSLAKQQHQQQQQQTTTSQQQQHRTVTAPPALRISRKLTRPERQLKLEQHLEEQLERINENKAERNDKETNTECVFMHPNQSTMMRMRVQQQQQQQLQQHQQSKSDPNYLTVKRSQTFNTRADQTGQDDNPDYVCRVSFILCCIFYLRSKSRLM